MIELTSNPELNAENIVQWEVIKRTIEDGQNLLSELFRKFVVEKGEVDTRVLSFIETMHHTNASRAEFYGKQYVQPTIFFIDREKYLSERAELFKLLQEHHTHYPSINDLDTPHYHPRIRSIVLFVNNFNDADVDAYEVVRSAFHELSHSGSIHHYEVSQSGGVWEVRLSRLGAVIFLQNGNVLGKTVDEGHHEIEIEIVDSRRKSTFNDIFLSKIPLIETIVPGGRQKYWELYDRSFFHGKMGRNRGQRISFVSNSYDSVGSYFTHNYANILGAVYGPEQKLYELAADFIYGGKVLPYARAINTHLESGNAFSKLMLQ